MLHRQLQTHQSLLMLVLAFGVFVRCFQFWVPGLWLDEYGTWWIASAESWKALISRAAISSTGPFYYFFTRLSLAIFGSGHFALRLPSVLFGVGVLLLAYPLSRRIFRNRDVALISLTVFSCNQTLIWYCQEARPYALALLFAMLSFYFYTRLLAHDHLHDRIGYVVATAVAFYTHYLFGFVPLIHAVHLLLSGSLSSKNFQRWLLTAVGFGLLCLPNAWHLFSLFEKRAVMDYLPPVGPIRLLFLSLYLFDPFLLSALALAVLVLRKPELDPLQSHFWHKKLLIIWFVLPIVCFGFVPPLFGLTLLSFPPSFHTVRYVLFILPAVLLITAWLFQGAGHDQRRIGPLIGLLIILNLLLRLGPALWTSKTFTYWPDQGFERAASSFKVSFQPQDMVLFSSGYTESDLLAREKPNFLLKSATLWPLLAHVSEDRLLHIYPLPFRINAQTASYLKALRKRALGYSRVWVIGLGPNVSRVVSLLNSDNLYRIRIRENYGEVQLFLLEKAG